MAEGTGHDGLWTKPRYPGDDVRMLRLKHVGRNKLGDIRIQCYSQNDVHVRVAKFLPGSMTDLPGDTPKCEPEESEFARNKFEADVIFDRYVQEAYEDNWENDYS